MAQVASGVNIPNTDHDRVIRIERRTLPALAERGMTTQVSSADITDEVNTAEADWRYLIVKYLRNPSGIHERTTRFRARCYLIYQNELYRKGSDGLLLLCPSAEDIKVIMAESHEGICGAHQSGVKMRWLVRRHGYYWPTAGTSPYALTYDHDAIVPMELKVRSLRVTEQPEQKGKDYARAMAQELEDLEQSRLDACDLMQAQKHIAARAYNKKVK